MSTTVVLAVLAAGLIHAVWNALAKSLHDQFASFALLNASSAVLCLVAWPFVGLVRSAAWPYLAVSVLCHVSYELFLMGSYRRADFSQSYPIARGTAPVLVTFAGLVFANEHLSVRGIGGVGAIVIGIVALSLRRSDASSRRRGVRWALATGVAIATYTVVDGFGVRASHDALRYAVPLFALQSTLWIVGVVVVRRREWLPSRRQTAIGLASGVLSISGYVIVLWAQTRAPLGIVSALRETGVLWAALIGAVIFHEGRLRRILLPAVLVSAGIVVLSLS